MIRTNRLRNFETYIVLKYYLLGLLVFQWKQVMASKIQNCPWHYMEYFTSIVIKDTYDSSYFYSYLLNVQILELIFRHHFIQNILLKWYSRLSSWDYNKRLDIKIFFIIQIKLLFKRNWIWKGQQRSNELAHFKFVWLCKRIEFYLDHLKRLYIQRQKIYKEKLASKTFLLLIHD